MTTRQEKTELESRKLGREEQLWINREMDVVFRNVWDSQGFTTKHWHDALEIIYILEGSTKVLMNHNCYVIEAGECMVINPSIVHSTQNDKGNRAILLQIPTGLMERFMPGASKDLAGCTFKIRWPQGHGTSGIHKEIAASDGWGDDGKDHRLSVPV